MLLICAASSTTQLSVHAVDELDKFPMRLRKVDDGRCYVEGRCSVIVVVSRYRTRLLRREGDAMDADWITTFPHHYKMFVNRRRQGDE